MASSEDDNNNKNDGEMGFQYRGEMSSGYKSSSNPFGSGWDPLENFGAYPVGLENHQGLIHHYQSGPGIADLVPKLGSFGSGSFSEMANPFASSINPPESPNSREKRRAPHSPFNPIASGEREERNDGSGDTDEKKQRMEHGSKQTGKQAAKDNSDSGGAPKDNYIHVRAKRGQATNSHSLAERVRRERISERMKLLQELVPGCNKITGKAVMLDEIINYVQSLQQQVEFLSMKLATVNPELNIDIDRLVFKDILHCSNPGFGFGSYPHPHGSLPATAPMHPIQPQPVWDHDLHNLLHMGFESNPGANNLGPNGRTKMDL